MVKLEIKQGSFIKQNPVFYTSGNRFFRHTGTFENLWFFHLSRQTTVIQDILVRRQFSLVPDNRSNVNVEACPFQITHTNTWPYVCYEWSLACCGKTISFRSNSSYFLFLAPIKKSVNRRVAKLHFSIFFARLFPSWMYLPKPVLDLDKERWGPSQFPTFTTGGRWKCV